MPQENFIAASTIGHTDADFRKRIRRYGYVIGSGQHKGPGAGMCVSEASPGRKGRVADDGFKVRNPRAWQRTDTHKHQ